MLKLYSHGKNPIRYHIGGTLFNTAYLGSSTLSIALSYYRLDHQIGGDLTSYLPSGVLVELPITITKTTTEQSLRQDYPELFI